MERRFHKDLAKENKPAVTMQKKLVENRRLSRPEPVPDLTDFMNDWFFGSANAEHRNYDLSGGELQKEEDEGARYSTSSRSTQEWLEEAKRMVATSPARHESPSRLVGSPRFAAVKGNVSPAALDRRGPLSRSARRHRSVESFSGEILSKSANHNLNRSEACEEPIAQRSPASSVHQWFSNILKPDPKQQHDSSEDSSDCDTSPRAEMRPPRLPIRRKSRFQDSPGSGPDTPTAGVPILSRRTFRAPAAELGNQVLSPPKNLIESAHRRSISSSTCSLDRISRPDADVAAPEAVGTKQQVARSRPSEGEIGPLNLFLREQRAKILRISNGEISFKAKIILSGSSNSLSSMVAAICYAWLLENKEKEEEGRTTVVPVMNVKRDSMWKHRQAAWIFHHVGIDAKALLFSDEVDLESLIMARQLSILVVGQDVLCTNGEVGSECTLVTDNYCEDAYDLLQTPHLKRLLLAGTLLDTQNLNAAAKFFTNRDAEAVQLLSVGSAPSQRHVFFDQLMQDPGDNSFQEAMKCNYGKPSDTGDDDNGAMMEQRVSLRKSNPDSRHEINKQTSEPSPGDKKAIKAKAASPVSAKKDQSPPLKQATEPSRDKNKFFLAKWFGFGSK